jgi:altronate dehydratase small subunit
LPRALSLHPEDNVATLVDSSRQGEEVSITGKTRSVLKLAGDIDYGHKVATRPIPRGEPVLKYGTVIGLATRDIAPGEHVHVHNVEALRARGDKEKA